MLGSWRKLRVGVDNTSRWARRSGCQRVFAQASGSTGHHLFPLRGLRRRCQIIVPRAPNSSQQATTFQHGSPWCRRRHCAGVASSAARESAASLVWAFLLRGYDRCHFVCRRRRLSRWMRPPSLRAWTPLIGLWRCPALGQHADKQTSLWEQQLTLLQVPSLAG